MADTIAVVTQDDALSVAVSEGVLTLSSTGVTNPAVVESMSDIANVDTTTLTNEIGKASWREEGYRRDGVVEIKVRRR